jgi:aldehyde:ferredoxin oxidoreductase
MKTLRKMYCRTFQLIMYVGSYALPWRQPELLEGENALRKLPELIAGKKCRSLLVVTDAQLLSLGLLEPLLEGLKKEGIHFTVFSNLQPNPTIDNVEEALALYHKNNCDSLLAFGGGSSMDCAKACGARVVKPNKSVSKMRGLFKVLHKLPPFFVVPTTAGTGSETTVAAVITDSKTHHKYPINDISLIPRWAVLDPTLTTGLPKHITASTGLDVLTHAVEAYIGRANTANTRRWAEEATRLVFENLEECYNNPGNLTARANMLKASYLGGAAFTRAYVGYIHAIAHTLGGFYSVPHGLANAIILPQMLERYGASVYKPLAALADVVGIKGDTLMEKAVLFTEAIKGMNRRMGIPATFSQIKEEDIDKMSTFADKEGNPLYPVPALMDKAALADVIRSLMAKPGDGTAKDTAALDPGIRYHGYTGKIADIDLATQTITNYPVSDEDRRKFLGGKGLAAKILFDNLPPNTDPYSEENILVITTGPMNGTGAPSSARFNISTISPLTGLCVSTNSGGDFGLNMKRCGYDGIILRNKSKDPVTLHIAPDGTISFLDGAPLMGKLTTEVHEMLGKPNIAIGPAGENKVRYASVMSGERACGRGGVGAVFGDKKVKAISADGKGGAISKEDSKTINAGPFKVVPAEPEAWKTFNMKWIAKIRKHYFTGGKCPELGTAMLVRPMQKRNILATRNFQLGRFDDFENFSGETMRDTRLLKNGGCTACPIHCARIVELDGKPVKGPELETIGLLGPNLMNGNLDTIIRLNYLLDQLGMDTMSTGGTLAFAMHLSDAGVADLGIHFGETGNLPEIIRQIAYREGVGDILAEGSQKMAEKYGQGEHAIHVKGMELAAYNPRNAVGQGLSYATANRGACHLNGGYLVLLEGLGLSTSGKSTASKAQLGVMFQLLMEAISSAGICLFTSYAVFPSPILKYPALNKIASAVLSISGPIVGFVTKHPGILGINAGMVPYTQGLKLVTGMPMTLGAFLQAGKNSYNMERRINIRQGLVSSKDTLPATLLEDVPLKDMMKKYYKTMEWN